MPTTQDLLGGIRQACSISCLEEDELEPYKNKYQAADLLKRLLGERAFCSREPAPSAEGANDQVSTAEVQRDQPAAASCTSEAVGSSGHAQPSSAPETELAAAAARIRCGLILLETDLLSDGEASVVAGLPLLEKSPEAFLAWLLESYNALGALYSERGDMPVALDWLKRAEELYQRITHTGTKHAHLATLPVGGLTGSGAAAAAAAPGGGKETDPHQGQQGEQQAPGSEEQTAMAAGTEARAAAATEAGSVAAAEEATAGPGPAAEAEPPVGSRDSAGAEAAEEEEASAAEAGGSETADRERNGGTMGSGSTGDAAATGGAAAGGAVAAAAAAGGSGGQAEVQPAAEVAAAEAAPPLPLQMQLPANDADAVQSQYTRTLYYLAQVHGHLKASDRSALYCAATLYRQLASGKYDLDTWVNNCLQLGGYYAKVHAYGLAMYCHAAAQAVADRDTAAGAVLGEDIVANIKLATARVYGARLAASHAKHVEGKDLEMHYPDVSYFPDYLRFTGLSVPSPDTFPWGDVALATSFEAARELLNMGMPYFKAALSYYQLDGWVTDHVGIVMDMSNMYRCLAGFEPDPSRAAAMHRCRAQLLEPLSGALSPDHFPGLSRSIDLELAHVYREISDVREIQGGQAAKVASAAASAARFYRRFLQSFVAPDTGRLPDRLDADNEPYFLMASFGLGRMMHRMRGPAGAGGGGGVEAGGGGGGGGGGVGAGGGGGGRAAKPESGFESMLLAAHQHLRWTTEYVKRHGLESWTAEAQAAEELSELLVEQMRLRAVAAAAARRGA